MQVSTDDRVEALHDAEELWEYGLVQDDYRRVMSAKAISYLGVFSVAQLAEIARVTVDKLNKSNVEGTELPTGKLNPDSLKTLRVLLASYRTTGKVSLPLVGIVLREGTDKKAILQLTGLEV